MAVDSGRRIRIWTIWEKYNSPEKCSASVKSTAFIVVLIMRQPGSRGRDEHANKLREVIQIRLPINYIVNDRIRSFPFIVCKLKAAF